MDTKRIVCTLLIIFIALSIVPHAYAQETYRWQINYQYVVLDIDRSGPTYMTYEVDANIVKGVWDEVWIPVTDSGMVVSDVVDGNGKSHAFRVDSGQIKTQGWNLQPGEHVYLRINSTLPDFVYTSDTPGRDIVTFVPPWWDMSIKDTHVKFYLPDNIPQGDITTGNKQWDNVGVEGNRTWVYFENKDLSPNEQFTVAVSYPDQYMAPGAAISKGTDIPIPGSSGGLGLLDSLFSCGCPGIFVFFIVIIIIGSGLASVTRQPYSSPKVSMDGIGVNKNLDPVEAATLLRIDPKRVLTMVMFGLMKKGNVKLISTDPVRLTAIARNGLNYYEKLFMDAIDQDKLNEEKLLECFKVLARRVVDKTRPYCRKDTEDYYRSKIEDAWAQIKAVDTPELKLQKYDTNMIWLMADDKFAQKTKDYVSRAPGSDTFNVPSYYWWYPYYFGLPHYYGTGSPQPQPQQGTAQIPQGPQGSKPSAPTNQTTASVESFANSITRSVEASAAGVVGGVEKFLGIRDQANAPPPSTAFLPASSSRPGHTGGGSSCACVSCACACVSCACACACAGGGGGCT